MQPTQKTARLISAVMGLDDMNEIETKYLGKHLLVGLTYLNRDESVREQIQHHGIINKVSESTVVFERADNGDDFSIPLDEDNLKPGEPGAVYKLKSTGEDVENVDFISSWTIHPPNNDESP